MGTRGAVASAHPLASMAGIQMLLAEGNAMDAAVAVASTLNVVEPFMSGIGGIGLMLVSRPNGERHVLDFVGAAPQAADVARCTEAEQAGGAKACATPGNLGGWLTAHARFGRLPRDRDALLTLRFEPVREERKIEIRPRAHRCAFDRRELVFVDAVRVV
jgi:gamma-glutamyltranspeptidase/glutathione hydrolase